MRAVVGLAGRPGSGKSTIACNLAEQHGFGRTSFGNVVRGEASVRGLGESIAALQELGLSLIEEWGWRRFCKAVLSRAKDTRCVVVDGVRHSAAVSTLRDLVSPATFTLVFVDIDEDTRCRRLADRGYTRDSYAGIDRHPVEKEILNLRSQADFHVDGKNGSAADMIAACVACQHD